MRGSRPGAGSRRSSTRAGSRARSTRRIGRFGIAPAARFGELSKGQKKQVSLALALATSPELLILDDPTLGLDVVARKSLFEEVLGDMADRGITVLVTTHDLAAVESIADRTGILDDGRLVLDEEVETLKARFRRIRFRQPAGGAGAGHLVAATVRQWGSGTEAVVSNYDDVAFARMRGETQPAGRGRRADESRRNLHRRRRRAGSHVMNTAVLIASRELRDRMRLFLIAAAMAIVPFGAALAVRENRQVAIATVACFLASAYTGALAVALGVSSVGRDLTEKRLSFFFSKPVSAAAIWTGKALAALVTLAAAFAIIVLPAFLLANKGWSYNWTVGGRALAIFTLIIGTVLFFASHAASTIFRSRSALVAVDFVLLAAMLTAILAMTRPILLGGGLGLVWNMLIAIGVALLVLLIVAPVWQLARGRIDPRRSHAAFSLVLWSGAAVVLTGASAYALWVVSAPLSSLTHIYNVEQSPAGRWLTVSGQTAGRGEYQASFIVDTVTGARQRVAVSPWGNMHVSRDGKTAVWMESDELVPRNGRLRLYTRRLEPSAKPVATQLVMGLPWSAQLTDDGSRLAVNRHDKIEVYDVSTGRLLGATIGIHPGSLQKMFFAGPDVVRILEVTRGTNPTLRLREFDVRRRKLDHHGRTAGPPVSDGAGQR